MPGVSSFVTFKDLLGKYFSIVTLDVIRGARVGKKYNVKLKFCVATWIWLWPLNERKSAQISLNEPK